MKASFIRGAITILVLAALLLSFGCSWANVPTPSGQWYSDTLSLYIDFDVEYDYNALWEKDGEMKKLLADNSERGNLDISDVIFHRENGEIVSVSYDEFIYAGTISNLTETTFLYHENTYGDVLFTVCEKQEIK